MVTAFRSCKFSHLHVVEWVVLLTVTLCIPSTVLAQGNATLRGSIVDEAGASIVHAAVTLVDSNGIQRNTTTDSDGTYLYNNLSPGKYEVRVNAQGFGQSESKVEVGRRAVEFLKIVLHVAAIESQVTVNDNQLSTDSSSNSNQIIINGRDLNVLPDDPEDLVGALQMLTGPSVGPGDSEILVDGFSRGTLPTRASIREIRINQNPLAAENDRASARTELFTQPGSGKLQGSVSFNFSDESLNSRNPFQTSDSRTPFQVRQLGANVTGPIKKDRTSFFLDFSNNQIEDNELVLATELDSSLVPVIVSELLKTPRRSTTVALRVDHAINTNSTITARYSYGRNTLHNVGVGGFSLPERGAIQSVTSRQFQVTETSLLSPTAVNETKLQYVHLTMEINPLSSSPTLNVSGSFIGGGTSSGNLERSSVRWELQNATQLQYRVHTVKFGGRLRTVNIDDVNSSNFNGTWIFSGGINGATSLERYQRTLELMREGFTPEQIREAGGGASQFNIFVGNPRATVYQYDLGLYGQDDWRIRPNVTLSYGLRYEIQNNAHSKFGFAPRFAIAWASGGGKNPKTVIRGGGGIYYNRFTEGWTLNTNRFNGINVRQFTFSETANPQTFSDTFALAVLNSYRCKDGSVTPNCASSLPSLGNAPLTQQSIWRIAPNLQVPAVYLFAGQVERQLPRNFTLAIGGSSRRIVHGIRSRDINAPIPETITPGTPGGLRPDPEAGEINQIESSGRWAADQLFVSVNSRLNSQFSIGANYYLSRLRNDTDGQSDSGFPSFPRVSYNLAGEWGRGADDIRHSFWVFGTFTSRKLWNLLFAPVIAGRSAPPFNIVTGIDSNLDRQFTERPSFAGVNADCTAAFIRCTRFGNFNLLPKTGEQIIPRNFGQGTPAFGVNLRISRTFKFGTVNDKTQTPNDQRGANSGSARATEHTYNLTVAVSIRNLLNTVNLGLPVGNLSSPLFGQSQSLSWFGESGGAGSTNAGNRRIYLYVQLSF